ncbi:MAG: zinc ribbon domain-containing protein [Atopobiaceae bacterium]|jgi:ribosomal protein L37AE/L43A|nr:zinc ribbon domain-containing protein [Atopobiaceae bacterium]
MFCINCGRENEGGARFCVYCGTPLDREPEPAGTSPANCPACGQPLVEGASFCTHCGAAVARDATTPMAPVAAPVQGPYVPVRGVHRPTRPGDDQSRPLVAVFLVALAIVALLVAFLVTGGFGLMKAAEAPTVQAPSSSSASSGAASAAASSSATTGDVAVQTSLSSYSWADLAKIAKRIEQSGGADAARKVARQYNLLNADGTVATSTKQVKLSDGTSVGVRVAGIYHDDLADGSGKAGITFVTSQIVTTHAMTTTDSNAGGWQGCAMRSWLAGTVAAELPSDLQGVVVSVGKLTNNVGKTTSASSVTKTSDKLWLLSEKEVSGDVSWTWDSDASNSSLYNAVLNAEGNAVPVLLREGHRLRGGEPLPRARRRQWGRGHLVPALALGKRVRPLPPRGPRRRPVRGQALVHRPLRRGLRLLPVGLRGGFHVLSQVRCRERR